MRAAGGPAGRSLATIVTATGAGAGLRALPGGRSSSGLLSWGLPMRRLILVVLLLVGTASPASAGIVARIDISSQTLKVSKNGHLALCMADLDRWERLSHARRHVPSDAHAHDVVLAEIRQLADAALDLLPWRLCDPRNRRGEEFLGRPASHGCVRLHPRNARRLYNLVKAHGAGNTRIVVQR